MIEIRIRKRQSGKTTNLCKDYKDNEHNGPSVMFSASVQESNYKIRKYYVENSWNYKETSRGWSTYDYLYFDECFQMSNLPMSFLHNLTLSGRTVKMTGTPNGKLDPNMEQYMMKYYPEYFI